MMLKSIQKVNIDDFFVAVSEYYDFEIPKSKLLHFEASIASQDNLREYINNEFFTCYFISKSIKSVKNKIANLY